VYVIGDSLTAGGGIDYATLKFTIPSTEEFLRGDANGDALLDLSDGVFILSSLFLGGEPPGCLDAADADDSGVVELTDAIAVLDHLFLGGRPPPAPGPSACGKDPGGDQLDCREGRCP
jgi:hypothetical protein